MPSTHHASQDQNRIRRWVSVHEINESTADPASARTGATGVYDDVDRRLMDTFPASDAVARY